ncbi:hypothetical protein BDC45DRAFT_562608 [Circinella umbellata]|nr:hypothetical protein BDC45DRAFT_562608 [Circinella umbellata]
MALVVFAIIFIFPVPLRYHFYLYQDVVFQDVLLTIPTIPIFFLYYFSFDFSIRGTQQMFPSNTLLDKKLQEGGIKEWYLGYVMPLTLRLALGGSVLAWLGVLTRCVVVSFGQTKEKVHVNRDLELDPWVVM